MTKSLKEIVERTTQTFLDDPEIGRFVRERVKEVYPQGDPETNDDDDLYYTVEHSFYCEILAHVVAGLRHEVQ